VRRPARPDGRAPIRERAFHRWLSARLPAGRTGPLALGDDAAALGPPSGMVAVVSTDSLVEGTHFLADSPPRLVGRAATAVSLSDVAAKGSEPAGVLLALIVPPGTPARWGRQVVLGAEREATRFGAHVVGGDTKPGPRRTIVSTVIGWGRRGRLAPRSGARPGDALVTTGTVGRGGLAYHRLVRGPRRVALAEMLRVEPRVREGLVLARYAHAMLDTSDGLAESSRLLADASRVRVVVDEALLPLAPGLRAAAASDRARRRFAFFGGDYELLAALPARSVAPAIRAVRAVGGRLTVIGRIAPGSGARLRTARSLLPMPAAGWRPFDRAHGR
jgi:thiamine-monophosphate kinase